VDDCGAVPRAPVPAAEEAVACDCACATVVDAGEAADSPVCASEFAPADGGIELAVAAGPAERCADACEAAPADPAGDVGVASVLDAVAAGCVLAASPAPADV